jgi:hypothetical protein
VSKGLALSAVRTGRDDLGLFGDEVEVVARATFCPKRARLDDEEEQLTVRAAIDAWG